MPWPDQGLGRWPRDTRGREAFRPSKCFTQKRERGCFLLLQRANLGPVLSHGRQLVRRILLLWRKDFPSWPVREECLWCSGKGGSFLEREMKAEDPHLSVHTVPRPGEWVSHMCRPFSPGTERPSDNSCQMCLTTAHTRCSAQQTRVCVGTEMVPCGRRTLAASCFERYSCLTECSRPTNEASQPHFGKRKLEPPPQKCPLVSASAQLL